MFMIALKMLFGDRSKYLMLLSGVMFSTILMTQGGALFCGIMSWTSSTLRNSRADIWVGDAQLEQINDNKPLRDTDVNRVRSVDGVAWAAPLFQGTLTARMPNGTAKSVLLIGVDATTLAGAPDPKKMIAGSISDLSLPNSVIVDEFGTHRLAEGMNRPLKVGDTFEINDFEARVVGICRVDRSFSGGPFVYTTYDRAVQQYAPSQRKLLSFVVAGVQKGVPVRTVINNINAAYPQVHQTSGLRAFDESELTWATIWWYVKNTGIPINVGTIVIIGFIVGTAVSGQTFYAFVLENTRNLGALRAMGIRRQDLSMMLIIQALTVGLIGYGVGMLLASLLGNGLLASGRVPYLLLWQVAAMSFGAVVVICLISAIIGIAYITKIEPAIVFRS